MATIYKLTWRTEQGGRWRKRYKGKDHYFPRREGETKAESYPRCLLLWKKKKAEEDTQATEEEPWHRALTKLIARTKARLAELQ